MEAEAQAEIASHSTREWFRQTLMEARNRAALGLAERLYKFEYSPETLQAFKEIRELLIRNPDIFLVIYTNHLAYSDHAVVLDLLRRFLDDRHTRDIGAVTAYKDFSFRVNPIYALGGRFVGFLFDFELLLVVQPKNIGRKILGKKLTRALAHNTYKTMLDRVKVLKAMLIVPEGERTTGQVDIENALRGFITAARPHNRVLFFPIAVSYPKGKKGRGFNFGYTIRADIGRCQLVCQEEPPSLEELLGHRQEGDVLLEPIRYTRARELVHPLMQNLKDAIPVQAAI